MRSLLVVSVAAVLGVGSVAGCSNTTLPTVQDAGLGFDVTDMTVLLFPDDPTMYIVLGNRPGLCDLLKSGYGLNNLQGSNSLFLNLANIATTAPTFGPLDAGTYVVVPGTAVAQLGFNAVAAVELFDTQCTQTAELTAGSGAVNISALNLNDGGFATGTYDIVFGLSRVQGSFDAGFCSYPPDAGAVLPDGGSPCI